jgi:hypothetical protein
MAVRDLLPYLAVAGQVFIFFNVEHLQIQVSFMSFTLKTEFFDQFDMEFSPMPDENVIGNLRRSSFKSLISFEISIFIFLYKWLEFLPKVYTFYTFCLVNIMKCRKLA